ncbi:MAG: hypothetical protein KAH22_03195 [Thiotrichaceae bacterium]|nr:hypothetical protein [Thiotrichaceae bacterium]
MKLSYALIISSLLISLSAPTIGKDAEQSDLAKPIVGLMKHFKAVRENLKLKDKQNIIIDNWMEQAPKRRTELEEEILELREKLSEAIVNRDTRIKRDALKQKLSEANIRLIEATSLCARMLHNTLTKEQYAIIVKHYNDDKS